MKYIDNYLSEGVVSTSNDLEMIRKHINQQLVKQAIEIPNKKQLSSCFEVMEAIEEIGLSHHCLPLLYSSSDNRGFKRLILS